jgi:hypothetical protein
VEWVERSLQSRIHHRRASLSHPLETLNNPLIGL